ncbi:hypothetical protein HpBTM60_36460 [Helicobacter pylori]
MFKKKFKTKNILGEIQEETKKVIKLNKPFSLAKPSSSNFYLKGFI